MNETARAILALLFAVVAVSLGNLFLSLAGRPLSGDAAIPPWVRSLGALGEWPLRGIGIVGHIIFFALWTFYVLPRLEMSVAVPITALAPVLAALLGYWLLRENMDWMRWLGVLLVFVGVALIGLSAHNGRSGQPAPPATPSANATSR